MSKATGDGVLMVGDLVRQMGAALCGRPMARRRALLCHRSL